MKLRSGVIVTKTDDKYIAVAAGEASKSFNGMIKLNETAAFILEKLRCDTTAEDIANAICEEYEVTFDTALENVVKVIEALSGADLIEK